MVSKQKILATALALWGGAVGSAQALDLLSAYRLAVENDATYQMARSSAEASREQLPQARAALLPTVGISLNKSNNTTDQTALLANPPRSVDYDYTAKSYALTVRQPLLRLGNYYQYQLAEAQVMAAEETLSKEFQSLVVRVATNYFDALTAMERLNSIRAQIEFLRGQHAMTRRAFEAGTGTRTDVEEAKARYDMALAQEIEASNGVRLAERNLLAVVGKKIAAAELLRLDPAALRGDVVVGPGSLEDWISQAEEMNPELAALRYNLEAAERDVDKNSAGHMPTVDLVASRSLSSSENNATIGTQYLTSALGVQVNIPLYSGGGVSSAVRQALANRDRVRFQLEGGRRQLEVNVTKEFNEVEQGVAKISALEQAQESARQALLGTEKGVLAGTRNNVDVLNARQQLTSVQLDLAQARHNFALANFRLKAAAGQLKETDLMAINGWLEVR